MNRRNRIYLGAFGTTLLLSCCWLLVSHREPAFTLHIVHKPWEARLNAIAIPRAIPKHAKVYAYSVIPGGVSAVSDLTQAIKNDPVVAQQFGHFDLAKFRITKVTAPRSVYISYRLANRTYWTKRKVTLEGGESLVTDGSHIVRARCGNEVSDVPKVPTSAPEPTSDDLDVLLPLTPISRLLPPEPPTTNNTDPPEVSFLPPYSGGPPSYSDEWLPANGSTPPAYSNRYPPFYFANQSPITPIATPEPSALLQIILGLLIAAVAFAFAQHKKASISGR
jgi:hypothetical protein